MEDKSPVDILRAALRAIEQINRDDAEITFNISVKISGGIFRFTENGATLKTGNRIISIPVAKELEY